MPPCIWRQLDDDIKQARAVTVWSVLTRLGSEGGREMWRLKRRLNGKSVELQPAGAVTAVTFCFSVICKLRKWRIWRWSKIRHERGGSGRCVAMATETAWECARGGARATWTATAASAVGFDPTGRRCFLSQRCYQPSISDSDLWLLWSAVTAEVPLRSLDDGTYTTMRKRKVCSYLLMFTVLF